jgi:hypothetical protein
MRRRRSRRRRRTPLERKTRYTLSYFVCCVDVSFNSRACFVEVVAHSVYGLLLGDVCGAW